jgi:hypothetical protein
MITVRPFAKSDMPVARRVDAAQPTSQLSELTPYSWFAMPRSRTPFTIVTSPPTGITVLPEEGPDRPMRTKR